MTVPIYLVKNNDKLVAVCSSEEKAKSISGEFQIIEFEPKGYISKTIFYVTAMYTTSSFASGTFQTNDVFIGPSFGFSLEEALGNLSILCKQHRMKSFVLDEVYELTINKEIELCKNENKHICAFYEDIHEEGLINLKNDMLVKYIWNKIFFDTAHVDADEVTLECFVKLLIDSAPCDLSALHNRYSYNWLVLKLVDMCENEDRIYVAVESEVSNQITPYALDAVGYVAFTSDIKYKEYLQNGIKLTIKELSIRTVVEAFEMSPEYGIYINPESAINTGLFIGKQAIDEVYNKLYM